MVDDRSERRDLFRELAREGRSTAPPDGTPGAEDDRAGLIVRTFVKDGRLVRLPARWTRKKVVLRHIAERTFVPGAEYPERTVDAKLRAWCDEGGVDHVTLRRHLVDLGHLCRSGGTYWRPAPSGRAGAV
ncbi:Putative secreted protein [Streptomyces ambofaciens ATCC 23877]|uniref:Putative secreted protein n=1 Tax=Streptomyces ambofaciens (strain ATCC 23877 / 3486 / DSM 40053 / JCM 4204 / NBRC 12836 / NRRL B-2516) TaxID=278992 RepID=A0A0K2ASH4_STRA7|nr:Putative secreted protein [Streptomyces ambofaciens ATCC 23877]